MFRFAAFFVSLLCLAASPVQAETVTFENGRISFEAPDGFEPLTEELLKIKFPTEQRPRYAVGTENAATTIAYDVKNHHIPADKLNEVLNAFSKQFTQVIPGIEWKEKKLIKLGGKEWVYLEFKSKAPDAEINNIMLTTGYEGKMLVFNFNSTVQDFKTYEPALRASVQSIRVK